MDTAHGQKIAKNRITFYACNACKVTFHREAVPKKKCPECGGKVHFMASKAETVRLHYLWFLERLGQITDLEIEPKLALHAPGNPQKKIGEYRPDFGYVEIKSGAKTTVLEDVKGGADTVLSAWKRKHAEAEYGIPIRVVAKQRRKKNDDQSQSRKVRRNGGRNGSKARG
jgi:DNA-directed RNA polymerase subunit RPC12/RpoP